MPHLLVLLAALLAFLGGRACRADQPVPPTFPLKFDFNDSTQRWANQSPIDANSLSEWTPACGRTGGGIHMKGTGGPADQMRVWRKVIINPPIARQLHMHAWAKGAGVDKLVAVVAQAHAPDSGYLAGYATTQLEQPLKGDFDWTELHATLDVPRGCANVQILLMLVGNGEVWFDDAEIDLGGEATLIVPGLFLVKSEFTVRSTDASNSAGTLLIPLPLVHADQAPLTFELSVDPPDRVQAITYEQRPITENWIARVSLRGLTMSENTKVSWESVVLAAPTSFEHVPSQSPLPAKWDEDSARWLASTRSVQSDDPAIRAVAKEIKGDSQDEMAIIKATLERMREILANQEGACTDLDAVQALTKKGSSTSAANLLAALLRANGIPARIIAGYPAWAGPLQTHEIVEAALPGGAWYPIEPSLARAPWPTYEHIAVAIVSPDDENASGPRPAGASGIPYLSLTEHEPRDAPIHTRGTLDASGSGCDHVSLPLRNFPEDTPSQTWDRLLKVAQDRWRHSMIHNQRPPALPIPDRFRDATPDSTLQMLTGG